MKYHYNRANGKVTIDIDDIILPDVYDVTSEERILNMKMIFDTILGLSDQDLKQILSRGYQLETVISRGSNHQLTFVPVKELVSIPVGTKLYHAAPEGVVNDIILNGLKSSDVSGDSILYGEHRIYFAVDKKIFEEDLHLKNRTILEFEYSGAFPLYFDKEFTGYDAVSVFAANNNQFFIKLW